MEYIIVSDTSVVAVNRSAKDNESGGIVYRDKGELHTIDERFELIIKQKAVVEKHIAELTETLHTLEFKEWYYTTAKKAGTTAVPRNMTLDELPEEYRGIRVKLRGE